MELKDIKISSTYTAFSALGKACKETAKSLGDLEVTMNGIKSLIPEDERRWWKFWKCF